MTAAHSVQFPTQANYKGNGYKLSAQPFLGSFGRTSNSYDWLMVLKATINQSQGLLVHQTIPEITSWRTALRTAAPNACRLFSQAVSLLRFCRTEEKKDGGKCERKLAQNGFCSDKNKSEMMIILNHQHKKKLERNFVIVLNVTL